MKEIIKLIVVTLVLLSLTSCEKDEIFLSDNDKMIGTWEISKIWVGNISLFSGLQSNSSSTQCKGITQNNVRCKNITTNSSGYCYLHEGQNDNNSDNQLTLSNRTKVIDYLKINGLNYCDIRIVKSDNKYYTQFRSIINYDGWIDNKTSFDITNKFVYLGKDIYVISPLSTINYNKDNQYDVIALQPIKQDIILFYKRVIILK